MNKILPIFFVVIGFLMTSCLSDDEPKDTVKIIEIAVSAESGYMYDLFDSDREHPIECMLVKIPASSSEWQTLGFNAIEGFTYEYRHEYLLKVKQITLANPPQDDSRYRYQLIEILEDKVVAEPSASIEQQTYNIIAEGGAISVAVKANGKLTAEPVWTDEWLSVSDVTKNRDGSYSITVNVASNDGFGRIGGVTIFVDGTGVEIVGIIQSPAQFGENVTVESSKEGTLPILLGEDKDNLRRIRNLTICAPLNGIDISYLKTLMITNDDEAAKYPLSLDLLNTGIWAGNKNPYELYRWDASKYVSEATTVNEELPANLFANSHNLVGISLPKGLKYIGYRSFWDCPALKSITIPNSVEQIASEAFYRCSSMGNINISKESNLTTIGSQAFATGTTLESVTIPECCIYINGQAFLGCNTKELHLNWTSDPEQPAIVPDPNVCTLYVPKGTIDLYKSIPCWAKYTNIVEETTE